MEIKVELRDLDENIHGHRVFIIHTEATVRTLKEEVHHLFYIYPENQELFHSGVQLYFGTLKDAGVTAENTIILKHAMLQTWAAYLKLIGRIKNITTSGATSRRRELAHEARKLLSRLLDTDFFLAYPKFIDLREEINSEINYWIYNTKKYMRRSIEKYFRSLFDDYTLELVEKPKKAAGVQLGFFVFVKDAENQLKHSYYAKTVGTTPRVEVAPDIRPLIDLTELFVYQLMKLIGIGPSEVHIIPDTLHSESIYICTRLIDDFRTASNVTTEELLSFSPSKDDKKQIIISEEAQKQLQLFSLLLCLEDLLENKGNYGIVERQFSKEEAKESLQELRIVDFRVNVLLGSRISRTKNDIIYLEKYIKQWDLIRNIEIAKKLTEEDVAIQGNKNVNRLVFDTYVNMINQTLQEFIKNQPGGVHSPPWYTHLHRYSLLPTNQAEDLKQTVERSKPERGSNPITNMSLPLDPEHPHQTHYHYLIATLQGINRSVDVNRVKGMGI